MNMIVGYEKEKSEIEELRHMLCNFESYRKNGVRIPRGLLLYGAPGVGKTVLARSIAGNNINIVELRASLCCTDDAPEAVSEVFETAKNNAPSVLLLDEFDKIAGGSGVFYMEGNDRVRKTLLAELDSLSDSDKVLVVATCNDSKVLGEALIRHGRFDRILKIDLPDSETRMKILEAYFSRIKAKKEFDVSTLALATNGFSGADLECLVNEAGILALRKKEQIITEADIRLVKNKMIFGALEKNPLKNSESLHRVAVHEAGHTLAAMMLCPDSIFGASVLPQGEICGHVQFVSGYEIKSVSEIENETAIILAGHVAERCELNEYLTGSCSDMHNAAMRLHNLFTQEAAYGYKYVLDDLNGEALSESSKNYLEFLVAKKLEELDRKVERIISDNHSLYRKIVEALEEKLVLSQYDLKKLMNETSGLCTA